MGLSPEREAYKATLKANNLKGAIVSLREASEHLERADEPALLSKCKELGRQIFYAAFHAFRKDYPELWKSFEGASK